MRATVVSFSCDVLLGTAKSNRSLRLSRCDISAGSWRRESLLSILTFLCTVKIHGLEGEEAGANVLIDEIHVRSILLGS